MEFNLTKQSELHLIRIQELKNCSEERAIELALGVAWLVYENNNAERVARMAKASNQDPNNKAPVSGSNKSSDNKATASGKEVDPNRPKSD
jgi:hypothetical protein